MNALGRLTWMEMKLFFREKQAVFWTFLFPVLMIWLFGSMFGNKNCREGGVTVTCTFLPGLRSIC